MEIDGPLDVLVFGAGAIGAYVGGSLALRGHRTVFVERAEIAVEIERSGLRIGTANGEILSLPSSAFRVAASPREALAMASFDVALVALKSYDVPPLISALDSPGDRNPDLPFLCLSNGVDNEPALARAFGPHRVIAGTVTTAVGRRAAGNVVVEKLRGTGVAAGHPLSERLARAMNEAGLNSRLYRRPSDMKWSKLLTNLLGNATSAILDMTPAEIFAHPGLYRLEVEQLREALRVMKASGIGVVNLPRTPVRLLALGASLPPFLSRPVLARAVAGGRGGKMPSFHIDLHSGRGESEVDHLHGAVVRHGEKAGIPTPVNRLLTDTLSALTRREIPIDTYARNPERLLEAAEASF
jgi:2-dehydropantoate 2-reductase